VAKKLSEIQDNVEAATEEFVEYIKRNVDVEVYRLLLKLTNLTEVYIFSGVIRNFFLQKEEIRDLDIVIRDEIDIEGLVHNSISFRRNSFGGYKINISEINIDLWTLESTWAIQYQKRLELDNEVENLHRFIPSTAFFNFSAILFSLNEKRFYYKSSFLSFLQNKEINYLYTPNANVALCVVNTLYYADKYSLKISDKLKRYLIQLYKTKFDYTETQIRHFGKIIYSDDYIKKTISNFEVEKRQKGDYLMENLEEIFTRLNLNRENGLYITKENIWKTDTAFPNRVKRLIEKEINPDAFFCFDNKPLILFFDNPLNKYELHKAIWNFNECPIAIIIENNIVEIFNGFEFDSNLELLKRLGKDEKLNDFSYFQLVTGKTWEQYSKHLHYKNRVDYHLLQNIKSARKLLVQRHNLDAKITNAIIGKAIFVRYLIDRKVKMRFDETLRTWSNDEFCELLNSPKEIGDFFNYLEDKERGFNGNLFPLTTEEYDKINPEHFLVVKRLLQGEDIDTGQPSLFDFYDFSIIPIEFISNVYELFIGQDNQKKEGAYYTPLFLVDYILKETVEKSLTKAKTIELKEDSAAASSPYVYCRVLDPACGSGIFLVETLRKIIEKYIADTNIDILSAEFKDAIINLAKENIYGIDKDASAVQVAIFSIYLTLLDYLKPPSIENFKFPELYNSNFFEADFFDEVAPFNSQLVNVSFQFILGNPPWKGNGMDSLGNQYLKNRKRKEKEQERKRKYEIAINNNEIAEGFVLRVSDFCNDNTQVSLIIRSSSLYNLGYSDESGFRQYWTEEYFIDKIFELAPVRHEIFEKSNKPAIAPAVVVFYRYADGKNTDANVVQHIALKQSRFFSLFKIFTINRSDYKRIEQNKFKEYDWIWKVLVYGSYLDFNFIKRLKDQFPTIRKVIGDKEQFIVSTGFHSRTQPLEIPKNTAQIKDIPFIKTRAIESFFIDYNELDDLEEEKIDIVKDIRIYKAPMLLTRKGLDMNSLSTKCAISKRDLLFKDGITSIKDLRGDNKVAIESIAAILSSTLFAYYAINTFVSIGIEREQTQNYNKFSLPYLELEVSKAVENIENLEQNIRLEKTNLLHDNILIETYTSEIKSQFEYIDESIYNNLNLTEIEESLIKFSSDINRTLITGDVPRKNKLFSSLPYMDEELNVYASLFIDKFKKLNTDDEEFSIEIWHTNQIIGMMFKMIPKSTAPQIEWKNKQNEDLEILTFLTTIGAEKITDTLFVQKDIRGFEKDYFYLFKPNERRLWHKAIGYLDVSEFADAILKEGRNRS
jgi:SAM-dependent methyltransferase